MAHFTILLAPVGQDSGTVLNGETGEEPERV